MKWEEYAKDLLIFQVKVFSLPIEDVTKIKINEFKDEFRELKKWLSKIEWDAEAHVENYYDEMGLIVDKLEILLEDEEFIFGNTFDDISTGPENQEVPVTLGELYEMNITNQPPTRFLKICKLKFFISLVEYFLLKRLFYKIRHKSINILISASVIIIIIVIFKTPPLIILVKDRTEKHETSTGIFFPAVIINR